MIALTALLWNGFKPTEWEPELIAAFVTALVLWIFAEFKNSEELSSSEPTSLDVTLGKRLAKLHQGDFRYILNDANLWTFIEVEIYREMWKLIEDWNRGAAFFSHRGLQAKFVVFMESLSALSSKVASDTTQEKIGGEWMIGYKPFEVVSQEEYDRLMGESKKADAMADTSWKLFEELIRDLRKHIPAAYDKN